tara:strand:+ start:6255 stop:6815 length:561 start_codon:yes stop_codon:yes gene_type:complete
MKKDLMSYVVVQKQKVPVNICNTIIDNFQDDWQKHTFYSHSEKEKFSTDTELSISHQVVPHYKELHHIVKDSLIQYIEKDIALPTLQGFDGFTDVRFNKYDENTQMHMHADRVQQMFDGERKGIPTLSVVGLLNDNFTGGDFIMLDDNKVELGAGDILIFPSTFMYSHKVTLITEGTRYSFVSWVW